MRDTPMQHLNPRVTGNWLASRNSATPFDSTASQFTVLIIEDDAPLGELLTAGLEANGYRALLAADARTGMEHALSHHPDVIVCDIKMPGKNGLELLQEMRACPDLSDSQFVLMTGNANYAQPRTGMELGADDFLLKPFTLKTLLACIDARLRRSEHQRHAEKRLIEQLQGSIHTNLPHEFFTPLTGIIGLADFLKDEIAGVHVDEARRILSDIGRSSRRLHRTLRNYLFILDAAALGQPAPQEKVGEAGVVELIRAGAQIGAERHGRQRDLTLDLAGAPLQVVPGELSLLVEELVDNAGKFSLPGSAIGVRSWEERGSLILLVRDNGRGMTPTQVQRLGAFHQFERRRFEQQGLGLGLAMAHRLLENLGGQLKFLSAPGHGTTCHVIISGRTPPATPPPS